MGREVKRVALDFEWPLNERWPGYLQGGVCAAMRGDCDKCRVFTEAAGLVKCPPTPTIEPPAGDGWQMWETTSEGSPISPVFASPEELAQWLADTQASACGSMDATYEQWLTVIRGSGYAPTMVVSGGHLLSGVAAVAATDGGESA